MTALEEKVIVQEVFDLDSRGFPPWMRDVEDMVNRLLATCDATYVGLRWASNFVKRQPELCMRWNRPYDYQRAQCEDPEIIEAWFRLFQNVVAKHGIMESDILNFDETGFLLGGDLENRCLRLSLVGCSCSPKNSAIWSVHLAGSWCQVATTGTTIWYCFLS